MIASPIIPDDPKDLPRFLRQYLGDISGALQTIANGQTTPMGKAQPKAQYWDDYMSPFNNAKVTGAAQPSWSVIKNTVYGWLFSATATNELFPEPLHITHTYKPGTAIYPHIHWCSTGTNTGVVRWGIEYTIARGHSQAAFPATTTIYIEQAATGVAYTHQVAEVSAVNAISSTEIEPDSLILMRVFRDGGHANDTCTDTVFGLMMDIHYQKSYWATKNKAPNFYK